MVPQALMCRPASADDSGDPAVEYSVDGDVLVRTASAGRFTSVSSLPLPATGWSGPDDTAANGDVLGGVWNRLQLDGAQPRFYRGPDRPTVKIVDMFCGCGGLSLGVRRAAEAVGARPVFVLSVDVAPAALSVYMKNLRPLRWSRQNVRNLVDYSHASGCDLPTINVSRVNASDEIAAVSGSVDIFLAGPPCQGNSNLNNRTRRVDRRNELYLDAVVAGIALDAKVIVIENVPAVTHSRQNVVSHSLRLLERAGYRIGHNNEFMLTASDFGTPQNRRRHFLIAGKSGREVSENDLDALKAPAPTVLEALLPLSSIERPGTFDRASNLSPNNKKRIEFLVDHREYDLPDEERPDCHRLKPHSYPSVYGRMRPDEVAPTITTGFLSPGRGRFTHPFEARSLTPHEGARLQGFGEDFNWLCRSERITRGEYAGMIGAAVPPQLGYVVGMCALSIL